MERHTRVDPGTDSSFSVFSYFNDFHGICAARFPNGLTDGHDNQVAVTYHTSFEQLVFCVIKNNLGVIGATSKLYWVHSPE